MADIINIFKFLKEFNTLSNPVITDLNRQEWCLNISDIPKIDEIRNIFQGGELDEMTYLEISRPTLSECPNPESSLIEWIKNDWKNLKIENVEIIDKLARPIHDESADLIYIDEFFGDEAERVEAYNSWISKRNFWREITLPKFEGLELYNQLYGLYSKLGVDSESVELIIGDGNIRWNKDNVFYNHPVLLQKVNLFFDARIPMFRIQCEDKKTELYTSLLRTIPSINQHFLSVIADEIDKDDYDIVEMESTKDIFKRIINIVDEDGEFLENPKKSNSHPIIYSAPVLFLRKRTLGFENYINNVIQDVDKKSAGEIANFFDVMTGIYKESRDEELVEENWNYNGIDENVLLTLPANNDQLRIIKYLDKYGAVLVQGPPGTGKTHTIANLIGHLLSRGNNVLVTSHTEKALSVLKEKVYRDPIDPELNLQNLCISILSSTSQAKEMDVAINEISSKKESLNLEHSKLLIDKLSKERKDLINEYKKRKENLIRVRASEYQDLIFDNHTISPIEASQFLYSGKDNFDYILGKSKNSGIKFPITNEELHFIYESNKELSLDEEALLSKSYPSRESFMSADEFTKSASRISELTIYLDDNRDLEEPSISLPVEILRQKLEDLNHIDDDIAKFSQVEKEIVNRTILEPTYSTLWEGVSQRIDLIKNAYESYRNLNLYNDFTIDESLINKDALEIIRNIIASQKHKPIGLFAKSEWKRIKDGIQLNGARVETLDEFTKAQEIIFYEVERNTTIKLLKKLLSDVIEVEDSLFDDFEGKVLKYEKNIKKALSWYRNIYVPILLDAQKDAYKDKTQRDNGVLSIDNLEKAKSYLCEVIRMYDVENARIRLTEEMDKIMCYRQILIQYADSNPLVEKLVFAVDDLDENVYRHALYNLNFVLDKEVIWNKKRDLLQKIRDIAPKFANQIQNRVGIHAANCIPNNFNDAWKHFQLRNQIEMLNEIDSVKIQLDIEEINNKLMKNARELALEKAWHEQIKNQTHKQNQALHGWRDTVKQIGKGTGKNAPRLKAKARELMIQCQTAIPVWIMALNRVVETFNPKETKFDVLIIDEASQANILSISAMYMAKKIIIVGDDEQVSPDSNFGLKSDDVNALIDQYLGDIPNNHLYNGVTSLYDIAKSSGFKPLMLTEHFRCLPEIIEFSNQLSYNGRIKPLRDSSGVKIHPPLVEYRVNGAKDPSSKINEVEANHIVSLVQAFVEMDEYEGQTIGVISMVGKEQSSYIERKLQVALDPIVYEKRRIQCGTPAQFQGDERDVILMSLVDSPNEGGGPIRLVSAEGNNDKNRKRYNVAVSRAKNQLWVVHSLNPEIDLKPDDLRHKLIKYAMNPNINHESVLMKSESPFEREVMEFLLKKGYSVIPQFKVGTYRIDMVIQYKDKRVALECDGERFHTMENLESDLARQAILERLGWRFVRIRGSEYYCNPEKTMENLTDILSKNGIYASFESVSEEYIDIERYILIDEVKKKANYFRGGGDNITSDEVTTDMNSKSNQEVKYKNIEVEDLKDISEKVNETTEVESYTFDSERNMSKKSVEASALQTEKGRLENNFPKDEFKHSEEENVENTNLLKPKFDFRKK